MKNIILVFILGGLGSLLRWTLYVMLPKAFLATLCVNLLGSFALGFAGQNKFIAIKLALSQNEFNLLCLSFIGAFTTFASFQGDMIKLFETQKLIAILYLAISLLGGLILFLLGRQLAS